MGQALYRKYRSKSLSEIIGQEHITTVLERALKEDRLSHAYLLTGPRGVGKTSIARILAHQMNGLPYEDDRQHMDIIEIDAASNRRIDEIRDLREKVHIAPTSAKYKVYIIDEVHMLTREAFNALLKTLEEPPAHVVFLLATTDAHKLPETIISRTQRFTFRPVEKEKVIAHLKHIAEQEKIKISDEALAILAEHGEGSFRDSISLLDQAAGHGKQVGAEQVLQLLGVPSLQSVEELLQLIAVQAAPADIFGALQKLYQQGFQAAGIAKQLGRSVREHLRQGDSVLDQPVALDLLGKLIDVPAAHDPAAYLEITLLAYASTRGATKPAAVPAQPAAATPPPEPKQPAEPVKPKKTAKVVGPPAEAEKEPEIPAPNAAVAVLDDSLWPQVLAAVKQHHNTLYSVVRMAQPDFSQPGRLELAFAFAFHQKRINDAKNRKVVADIIQKLTGQAVSIECVLRKNAVPQPRVAPAAAKPASEELHTISNIFGGGELLES